MGGTEWVAKISEGDGKEVDGVGERRQEMVKKCSMLMLMSIKRLAKT